MMSSEERRVLSTLWRTCRKVGKIGLKLYRLIAWAMIRVVNIVWRPHSVNLGGGPMFAAIGWRNLDSARTITNRRPFTFSPECTFPLAVESTTTVYASHVLEHLDDTTVARVLSECRRVLRADGRLVIKLPDFDRLLAAWLLRDQGFFST